MISRARSRPRMWWLSCLVLGAAVACEPTPAYSGYVAVAPPPEPVEYVVVAPGPQYVWVPGYYTWSGARYVWVTGRWSVPDRGRHQWNKGHWKQSGQGWRYQPGHWS